MNRLTKPLDSFMKCLGFVLLLGFIAIGTVGGCNNVGTGGGTDGVVNRPSINEPKENGQIVHPADVHMETSDFSSSDPGLTHDCSDWEIRTVKRNEVVWEITCIFTARARISGISATLGGVMLKVSTSQIS